ncbi:MAG: hypothetical protein PHS74_12560 [Lachnospiraceae bacterium]|nr:hypothetical protein [Lachnospiraceae bacterium]
MPNNERRRANEPQAVGWPDSTDDGGQCRRREAERGCSSQPCHAESYRKGNIIYTLR